MKRIAVIGAGISGLAASYFLSRKHQVHLFETEARLGGHTHTVEVDAARRPACGSTPGSSSTTTARIRTWCGCSASSASRRATPTCRSPCRAAGAASSTAAAASPGSSPSRANLCEPVAPPAARRDRALQPRGPGAPGRHRRGGADARRFPGGSRGFGDEFAERYLLPMASAIWSASLDAIRAFPALTLVRFFDNHGLLGLRSQPTWKVVSQRQRHLHPSPGRTAGRTRRARRDDHWR